MRKFKASLAGFILFVLVSSGTFLTCNIGLGNSVDTNPPTISITYPPSSPISKIRGDFVVAGTGTDETILKDITVTLANTAGSVVFTGNATKNTVAKTWQINIQNHRELDGATGDYAAPNYPDGEYTLTATAIDGVNRTTMVKAVYILDNTAPVVVVSRPGTNGAGTGDEYGADLEFSGTLWDSNKCSSATYVFYKTDGSAIPGATFTSNNLPQDWRVSVPSDVTTLLRTAMPPAVKETFYYTMSAQDDAFTYTDPSVSGPIAGGTVETGNTSRHIFTYNDIVNELASGEGYPPSENISTLDNGNGTGSPIGSLGSITFTDLKKLRMSSSLVSTVAVTTVGSETPGSGNFLYDPDNVQPAVSSDSFDFQNTIANGYTSNSISALSSIRITIKRAPTLSAIKYSTALTGDDLTVDFPNQQVRTNGDDEGKIVVYFRSAETKSNATTWLDLTTYSNWSRTVIDPTDITSSGSLVFFNYTVNQTIGDFDLLIRAKDYAGNSVRENMYSFKINDGAPYIKTVEPSKEKVYPTAGKIDVIVTGHDGSTAVTLAIDDLGTIAVDDVGTFALTSSELDPAVGGYNLYWNVSLDAEANGLTKDYRFQLYDGTYKSGSVDRHYTTDTNPPVLTGLIKPLLNSGAYGNAGNGVTWTTENGIQIQGYGDSTDALPAFPDMDAGAFCYTLADVAPASDDSKWTAASISTDSTNPLDPNKKVTGELLLKDAGDVASEGDYFVWYRLADDTGVFGPITRLAKVIVDKTNPVLIENTLNTTDTLNRKASFTLSGTLTDSKCVALTSGVTITATKDGVATASPTVTTYTVAGDSKSASWSTAAITPASDGLYVYTISGKDSTDKSHTVVRTVLYDTSVPTITPTALTGWKSGTVNIGGTALDPVGGVVASGLEQIEYQIDSTVGTWLIANSTATWSATIDTGLLTESVTGTPHTIYVRSKDKAGNYSTNGTLSLNVDRSTPIATMLVSGTSFVVGGAELRAAAFTLSGDCDDESLTGARKATTVVLSYTKDGGASSDLTLTTGGAALGTWSYDQAVTGSNDGLYVYTITVTDAAGNSTTATKTVRIDKTIPVLSITSPGANESFLTNIKTLTGTAVDLGSGIDTATLTYNLNGAGALPLSLSGSSWTVLNSNLGAAEGTKTLTVAGKDMAGNTATSVTTTFYYDLNPPVLSETTIGNTDTLSTNASFSFSGSLTDTNAVASSAGVTITATKDGSGIVAPSVTTYTVAGDSKSATWSTGSITPASDGLYVYTIIGTDTALKTGTVQRTIRRDTAIPTITPTALSGWKSGSISIEGAAADVAGGSGLDKVYYQIDSTVGTWIEANGTNPWSATIDTATLTETVTGTPHTIYVRSKDKAGNYSTNGTLSLNVDRASPLATMLVSGTSLVDSGAELRAAAFTLSGDCDDEFISSGRKASTVVLSYSKDGVASGNLTLTTGGAVLGTWSYDQSVTGSNDGLYVYTITVTDAAANISTATKTVRIDKTIPVLSITSPGANESFLTNTKTLTGTAVDLGSGIDTATLTYNLNGAGALPLTLVGSSWTVASTPGNLGAAEGTKTLTVAGKDKVGNTATSVTTTFYYDLNAPVLSETTIGNTDTLSTNGSFTLSGSLTDTNAVAASSGVTITATKDGVSTTAPAITTYTVAGDSKSASWSTGSITPASDGLYVYTIVGTDTALKTHTVQRTIRRDTAIPTITPTALSGWKSGSISIEGTAADVAGGTGLDKVYYQIDSTAGTWIEANGTSPWSATIDTASLTETVTGTPHTIYVRSKDKAGNYSTNGTLSLNVDRASPLATMLVSGTSLVDSGAELRAAAFTLSGDCDDEFISSGRKASTVVLSYSKDGVASGNLTLTTGGAALGTWSYVQAVTGSNDGLYVYTLTVTDVAGNSTIATQTVRIDNTVPVVSITSPAENESFLTNTKTLTGTAVDLGSGIDTATLTYNLNGAGALPLTLVGSSWTVASTPGNLGAAEGTKTLTIAGKDKVGNTAASVTTTFYYDLNPPVLSETTIGNTDTLSTNGSFTLSGSLTDTNAVAASSGVTITATKDGVSTTAPAVTTYTVAGGSKSATWSTGSITPASDGLYVYTITGLDGANKTHSIQRTVRRDTTIPTIAVTTNLSGWKGASSLAVAGTSGDGTGSGVTLIEYTLDAGTNWTTLAGTTSWSGTITVVNGTNTISFRSKDAAGNYSTLNTNSVTVDLVSPVVTVTTPGSLARVNGLSDLATVFTGTDTAGSGIASVKLKIGSTDFTTPDASTSTVATGTIYAGTWNASLTAAKLLALTNGSQYSVSVLVTDNAGQSTTVNFPILVDKQDPTVAFTSPAAALPTNSINKITDILGTAGDDQALKTLGSVVVAIESSDLATWTTVTGGTFNSTAGNNWTVPLNTETYGIAGYDTDSVTDGIQITLRVTATDEANNTVSTTRSFNIDQDGDRPIIKLTNISSDGTGVLKNGTTLQGTVRDDDGITSLKISQGVPSDWALVPAVTVVDSGFEYEVTGGDGTKNLYFQVVDTIPKTFTTDTAVTETLNEPRIWLTATPTYAHSFVTFKLDNSSPEVLEFVEISTNGGTDWSELLSSSFFGGTATGSVRIRTSAWDANGLDDAGMQVILTGKKASDSSALVVTVPLNAVSGLGTAVGTPRIYTTDAIDLTVFKDDVVTLQVKAKDTSLLYGTRQKTISVDNTKPTVTFSSPLKGEVVFGTDVEVKGTGDDNLSGIASVSYRVGRNAETAPDTWVPVSTSASFTINFKTGALPFAGIVSDYAIASEAVETYSGSGLWQLPIQVRVIDKAGNIYDTTVNETTPNLSTFYVTANPNGDNPIVSIVSPYDLTKPLGGTIRLQGTTYDTNGVWKVFLQIDGDMDGTFENTDINPTSLVDWGNGGNGREVTGTTSWSQVINGSNEFNPASGIRLLKCRAKAQDTKNGTSGDIYGPWTDFTLIIDLESPTITNIKLDPDTTVAGDEIEYNQGMAIGRPSSGRWTILGDVKDNLSITTITVASSRSGLSGALDGTNASWFSGTAGNRTIAIPVDITAGTAESITLTISATDNTEPSPREVIMPMRLEVDAKAPTAREYESSTSPIVQDNGKYKFTAYATDDGTDVDRIEVYFVRRERVTTTNRRFFWPKGSKGTPVGWSEAVAGAGATFAWTATDVITVTNGADYPNLATFDYPKANLSYLVKVDSKTELGGQLDSTPDGDMYNEYLKQASGNEYRWYVEIDSSSIPDGPIELHYIVWDSAGNGTHYVKATEKVQNNGPLVGKIWLGADLNSDSTITTTAENNENKPFSLVSVVNADPKLQTYLAGLATSFKVKGGSPQTPTALAMTVLPEVVNGNNNLYYRIVNKSNSVEVQKGLLRTGAAGTVNRIELTTADMTTLTDSIGTNDREYIVQVWDQTEETINYGNTPASPLTWNSLVVAPWVGFTVNMQDLVPPKVVINRFDWTSDIDNNLYDDDGVALTSNGKTHGHIEITGITGDTDPNVSGKISIKGTAWDDQQLSAVYLKMDSFVFANGLINSSTALSTYTKAASYSGGSWTYGTTTLLSNNWLFTVTSDTFDQDKHMITWRLDINTSKLTGVVGLDKMIRFAVEDKIDATVGNSVLTDQTPAAALLDTVVAPSPITTNRPNYRVDVVPYISFIETELGNAFPVNRSISARTASGKYMIWRKQLTNTPTWSSEQVRVKGFNLNPTATNQFTVSKDTDGLNAGRTAYDGVGVKISNANVTLVTANTEYLVTLSELTSSGYLNMTVIDGTNYIPTINNVNDNEAKGSYTGTLPSSFCNREPNGVNNDILSDDRWIDLWQTTATTNTGDIRQLDMEVSGNTLNFGAGRADDRYAIFPNLASMTATYTDIRSSYTRYFDGKIAYNQDGTTPTVYSVSQCGDTLGVPVNAWNLPSHFAFVIGTPAVAGNIEYGNTAGSGRLFLESNWNGSDMNKLDRVQWPDMKVRGTNTLSHVYLSYYDATQKLLKFRYFQVGTAGLTTGLATASLDGTRNTTMIPYASAAGGAGTVTWGSMESAVSIYSTGGTWNQGFTAIAGANANSPYSAVAFTSTGTAIVSWYDAPSNSLKLKYNTAPATAFSGYQAFNSQATGAPAAGTYNFRLAVDGVAQNGGNEIAVTFGTPTYGDRKHSFAYQLNKVLSENYNCYAEVDPVTSRVTVRSFQTGASSSIAITAGTTNNLLATLNVMGAVAGTGTAWVTRTIDSDSAGKYVSMTVDTNNGIHIAYQQTNSADLRYAYLSGPAAAPVVITVDSYGQVGQYTDITTRVEDINVDTDTEIIPYISYYNMSSADTKYSVKLARLNVDAINTVDETVVLNATNHQGAVSEKFTGMWEVTTVPAREVPKQYRVNVGIKTNGELYVGYQGDNIEYARFVP